jgi:hypothetical protein
MSDDAAEPIDWEAVFASPELPRTTDQARVLGWQPVRSASKRHNDQSIAHIKPEPPGRREWHAALAAIAVLCVVVLAVTAWLILSGDRGVTVRKPERGGRKTTTSADPSWDATKPLIRDVLRPLEGERVGNLSDNELLDHFVRLFERPTIESLMNPREQESYSECRGQHHPFLDYLDTLPKRIPRQPDMSESEAWCTKASAVLQPLAEALRSNGHTVASNPLQLVRDLRDNCLSYPKYFREWKLHNEEFSGLTVWCEEYDKLGPLYKWQPPVRKLLKTRYGGTP